MNNVDLIDRITSVLVMAKHPFANNEGLVWRLIDLAGDLATHLKMKFPYKTGKYTITRTK